MIVEIGITAMQSRPTKGVTVVGVRLDHKWNIALMPYNTIQVYIVGCCTDDDIGLYLSYAIRQFFLKPLTQPIGNNQFMYTSILILLVKTDAQVLQMDATIQIIWKRMMPLVCGQHIYIIAIHPDQMVHLLYQNPLNAPPNG